MNASAKNVIALTRKGFMGEKHKEDSYSFFPRFICAFLGSAIFHFSLFIVGSIRYEYIVAAMIDNLTLTISLLYLVYISIFALIVASTRKGSLMRHFSSGVALPGFTYWICSIIVWIISNINVDNAA